METRNATMADVQSALVEVNKLYDGNVQFKHLDMKGRNIQFTLRVADSHGKGARLGFPNITTGKQRHLPDACLHVHGHFFEALFAINPSAAVVGGYDPDTGRKLRITKDGGNWQDRNIGSQVYPLFFSEACECNK